MVLFVGSIGDYRTPFRTAISGRHRLYLPLLLKTECELAEVPVCGAGSSLNGNEELRCGIIRAALVLNEEQVLPLQRSRQA